MEWIMDKLSRLFEYICSFGKSAVKNETAKRLEDVAHRLKDPK